jgi:hypothetical protein
MASREIKIECPKCAWEPKADSLWSCSCGHAWNTFDTGGQCPSCKIVWEHTQCLSPWEGGCEQWSLHLDWYKGLDKHVEEEVKEVQIQVLEEVIAV